MDWTQTLNDVNYIAVIVAAVASMVLGFAWYSWPVFGEKWVDLVGMTREEADSTDGLGFALWTAAAGSVAAAAVLAALMSATGTDGAASGLLFGVIVGAAYRGTSILYHNGFERRPKLLSALDSAHDIAQLGLMGAILGAM